MKRILLFALIAAAAISCRKVTVEEVIAGYDTAISESTLPGSDIVKYQGEKAYDFLTLALAKEGIKDIWSVEDENGTSALAAQIKGHGKTKNNIQLITADISDGTACTAAVEMIRTLNQSKVRRESPVRVVFYNGRKEVRNAGRPGDMYMFDLELQSVDSLATGTFVIDDEPQFYRSISEIITPYLAPLGNYQIAKGSTFPEEKPVYTNIYSFNLNKATLKKDIAALTAFVFIMN